MGSNLPGRHGIPMRDRAMFRSEKSPKNQAESANRDLFLILFGIASDKP
jgi:hypothetical protein